MSGVAKSLLWAACCLGPARQACAQAASAIPYKVNDAADSDWLVRVVLALIVCAVVGAVAIQLLRKSGHALGRLGPAAADRLQVLEIKRLGPKSSLIVLRYEDQQLLIAQGEGGTTLLHQRDERTQHERIS